jgi:hypothetical protein
VTRPATRLLALGFLLTVVIGGAGSASAGATGAEKSPNISLLENFPYNGGTDIDFRGKYVYAGVEDDAGGLLILDVSGGVPRKVGFVPCPGSQNDVAVVKPGIVAMGFHNGGCLGLQFGGIRLIDVRSPSKPRMLGTVQIPGGTHTLTVYPGQPFIFASPGGLGGVESIIDVSDPKHPAVVAEYGNNPAGCHDLSFHVYEDESVLAFCPGAGSTEIWDASTPTDPQLLSIIPGHMEFPHAAVASPDGDLLLVSDEAFVGHECVSAGHAPVGALWAYDISNPAAPILMGQISNPRGSSPVAAVFQYSCTAHNLNFIPDTRLAVVSWYTAGTTVVDFSNPTLPVEVAFFREVDSYTWSSYYYRGLIYANDLNRGLDVLKLES